MNTAVLAGLLRDAATTLVWDKVPDADAGEWRRLLLDVPFFDVYDVEAVVAAVFGNSPLPPLLRRFDEAVRRVTEVHPLTALNRALNAGDFFAVRGPRRDGPSGSYTDVALYNSTTAVGGRMVFHGSKTTPSRLCYSQRTRSELRFPVSIVWHEGRVFYSRGDDHDCRCSKPPRGTPVGFLNTEVLTIVRDLNEVKSVQ